LLAIKGFTDLVRTLDLPVMRVVGVRLGAINHALLTYEAIIARGVVWVGSIATMRHPI
jgi:dethiobiotin synthetase